MGKEKSQKGYVYYIFIFLALELTFVAFLVPKETIISTRDSEQIMVSRYLGEVTEKHMQDKANDIYRSLFVETGMLHATYDYFGSYSDDGVFDDRGLGWWVEQRIDVVWLTLHLVTYRASQMLIWLPYLLPFFVMAIVDGTLQREIRKWQFSFSSPMAHKGAYMTMVGAFAFTLLAPLTPFAIPPIIPPILFGVVSVGAWVYLANMQKRI